MVFALFGFLSRAKYVFPAHYLTTAEETELIAIMLAFSIPLNIGI